ncbi:MAG: RNA-directed DNA polymerase, partial [bacterium]|nr:RNA-directed DNA polymerase [bacterium]
KLNLVSAKDIYLLPNITTLLDSLGNVKYFSTLDLHAGYHQLSVAPEHIEKTAFTMHVGNFEYTKVLYGLQGAPSSFQRLMNFDLAGLQNDFAACYLDDVLVWSVTFPEHLENLQKVFDRLDQHNLRLKPTKCCFGQTEVLYLGHMVSKFRLHTDPKKIIDIQKFPELSDQTGVRRFLGMASYYRCYISQFATIASPLHSLLKIDNFHWTSACQAAFQTLKKRSVLLLF